MFLFDYWLLSAVFLGLGMLGYWGFGIGKYAPVHTAKYCLLGILLVSFLLPCCLPHVPNLAEGLSPQKTFDYHTYNEWNVVDISDQSLLGCYEKAKTNADFCHCEIVQKSNLLVYAPNPYYNLLANLFPWCVCGLFGIGGVLFAYFGLKLFKLQQLIRQSRQRQVELFGTRVILLYPNTPFPVSAVRLGKKYIFWSESLDKLPELEQKAILAHEFAHLQACDTWALLGFDVVKIWAWLNPFWYWAREEYIRLSEFVADEFAARQSANPKTYAKMLLALKTQSACAEYGAGFAQARKQLKSVFYQRVHRLLVPPKMVAFRWRVGFFAFAMPLLMWGLGTQLLAVLETQHIALTQYQILQTAYQESGLPYYCPDCFGK
jgi:Zn-dependent protease with chaperone function